MIGSSQALRAVKTNLGLAVLGLMVAVRAAASSDSSLFLRAGQVLWRMRAPMHQLPRIGR